MASESPTHVTLISSDGFEFIITREAACIAGTLKTMLDGQGGGFMEAQTGRCKLSTIKARVSSVYRTRLTGAPMLGESGNSGVILEKVCEYLYYNLRNQGQKDVPDMEIPPELCLELLLAADYLNV